MDIINFLTANLIGIHFQKPKFALSKYFPDILDAIQLIPGSNVIINSTGGESIIFNIDGITVNFNVKSIIFSSRLFFTDTLVQNLPDGTVPGHKNFYNFYGDTFLNQEFTICKLEVARSYHSDFIKTTIELLELFEKIIGEEIPNPNFSGYMEYYAIPLNVVNWTMMDDFDKTAEIPDAIISEKRTWNRYHFGECPDEKVLIFQMIRPMELNIEKRTLAGAIFDFQLVSKGKKSIVEYGGPKEFINTLKNGCNEVITKNNLLKITKA
jgi:hypothetical protein